MVFWKSVRDLEINFGGSTMDQFHPRSCAGHAGQLELFIAPIRSLPKLETAKQSSLSLHRESEKRKRLLNDNFLL